MKISIASYDLNFKDIYDAEIHFEPYQYISLCSNRYTCYTPNSVYNHMQHSEVQHDF